LREEINTVYCRRSIREANITGSQLQIPNIQV
jgi:hypothetical protein